MKTILKHLISSALFAGLFLAAPALAQNVVGTASVIDGDTLDIHGQRIRFHGLDAPESSQLCFQKGTGQAWRCGQQAALALSDFIARRPVSCEHRDTDRYNRMIAVCSVGGVSLNEWMVSNGWAVAYSRYSKDYVPHESRARAAGAGIWASDFDAPWDYRANNRKR